MNRFAAFPLTILIVVMIMMIVGAGAGCTRKEHALSSFAEAETARIGVMTGSTGEAIARSRFPKARLKSFDDIMDAVAALLSGQLDAIVTAYPTAIQVAKTNPELWRLQEPLDNEDTAIAVRKDEGELLSQLNRIILELKDDGTLESMKKRWFKTDRTPYQELSLDIPTSGKPLRVGVSATREPFSFIDKDGRISGHDGELARIIAVKLRRPLEFSDMKFMALIPALQSGKVDLVVTGMTATDERRKKVDFTNPYFANAQVLLVKKTVQKEGGAGRLAAKIQDGFRSNIIDDKRYLLLWDGLKTTIVISLAAAIFGTLLGALVCSMRMSTRSMFRIPAQIYISILRGAPVLVLLMLIFYVVFAAIDIDPVLVAIVAFGLNFAAYGAEIFRTGIESIDKGQTEAGIAMGFTRRSTFLHIVLPQTIQRILPVYKGEFISLVKMTSIVGYIAVQDLTKASDIIRSRTFDAFFPIVMVAILYLALSWLLMQGLRQLERATDPQWRRKRSAHA